MNIFIHFHLAFKINTSPFFPHQHSPMLLDLQSPVYFILGEDIYDKTLTEVTNIIFQPLRFK